MKVNTEALFTESQRFRQLWVWVLLLGVNALFIYAVYQQLVLGKPFGDEPMDDTVLVLVALFSCLFSVLFSYTRLDTEITKDGINIRFFPIHQRFRQYRWEVIRCAYIRKYRPISEYGGWGMRTGIFGRGRAYNVSGNQGIQLVFTDNKRLLIGTVKPAEAEEALAQLGKLVKED